MEGSDRVEVSAAPVTNVYGYATASKHYRIVGTEEVRADGIDPETILGGAIPDGSLIEVSVKVLRYGPQIDAQKLVDDAFERVAGKFLETVKPADAGDRGASHECG